MTCCVAAVCDNGKSIVLVADKLIGFQFVEAQPDIKKIIQVHKNWWIMFAAEDISPVFEIADSIKADLRRKRNLKIEDLEEVAGRCYEEARIGRAVHKHLKRWGMNPLDFVKSGRKTLGTRVFNRLRRRIVKFDLRLELIVAGFDSTGQAKLFRVDDDEPQRQDIPGFCAIGSGALAADYIMTYRGELYVETPLRKAIYYVLEGKYFGESAQGVGTRTDVYILRDGMKPLALDEDEVIEKKLFPLCEKLAPGDMDNRPTVIRTLNELPLKGVPLIKVEKEKSRKRKPIPKPKPARVGNIKLEIPLQIKKSRKPKKA